MGENLRKGRTPGKSWPKCLEWTQWCFSKPLGHQYGLLRRNSFFKSRKFQKWHSFCLFFVERVPIQKIAWIKGHFWNFWDLKKEFLLNKPYWWPKGLEQHQWVHSRHFGQLSPGVQTSPPITPSLQNNEYFRDLPSYRKFYIFLGKCLRRFTQKITKLVEFWWKIQDFWHSRRFVVASMPYFDKPC